MPTSTAPTNPESPTGDGPIRDLRRATKLSRRQKQDPESPGRCRASRKGPYAMTVLVLNAGSSNLKFQLIATDREAIATNKDIRLCRGQIDRFGGEAVIALLMRDGSRIKFTASTRDMQASLECLMRWIASDASGIAEIRAISDVHAVGHRIGHGGELFVDSTLITDEVLRGIEDCIELAPLHNPNNITGILAARQVFGATLPQVAVFDTSFHHSIPEHAY